MAAFGHLEDLPSLELPGLDFLAAAASYGCPSIRVTNPDEVADTLEQAINRPEPVLIDVVVDRAVPPLLPSAEA
jgi:benzoylformate decarboxylase